jgi:hypothetical protein
MDKAWVVLKKTIDSPVVNIKSYTTVPSSFFKYLRQDSTNFFFKVYKNKSVSYLFFLLESDKTLRNVLEFKEYWLDLNLLSLPLNKLNLLIASLLQLILCLSRNILLPPPSSSKAVSADLLTENVGICS